MISLWSTFLGLLNTAYMIATYEEIPYWHRYTLREILSLYHVVLNSASYRLLS